MKRYVMRGILILFPIFALGGIFWSLHVKQQNPMDYRNVDKKPLQIQDNSVQCPQCFMYVAGKKDTAQIISKEGKTYFFDDVGCAILWTKKNSVELSELTFWVYAQDSATWIDAHKAYYSTIEETPMRYGFRAHEKLQEGMIDFEEMRLRMFRGETMNDPKIRKRLSVQ